MSLLQAYLRTNYVVFLPGEPDLGLSVGSRSARLSQLMAHYRAHEAAFLTAYNPASLQADDGSNRAAQETLHQELIARSCTIFFAEGRDSDGLWPPEPSFLVLGLSYVEAGKLAERFEQAAILFSGKDAVPRLCLGYALRGEAAINAGPPPLPNRWAQIHRALQQFADERRCLSSPPMPLILAGAAFSSDHEKQARWNDTAAWAYQNGCSDLLNMS